MFDPGPCVYMEKIAVGPGYAQGVVDLDATPGQAGRDLGDVDVHASRVAGARLVELPLGYDRPTPGFDELGAAPAGTGESVHQSVGEQRSIG